MVRSRSIYQRVCHVGPVQLPLQQLAWLLHDQKCRLLLCGHGPAGAVAQHAALVIQQHLRALLPGQVRDNKRPK